MIDELTTALLAICAFLLLVSCAGWLLFLNERRRRRFWQARAELSEQDVREAMEAGRN